MVAANLRGTRRDIAVAVRGERKRTLYEISKAMGRRPGDIQRTVRQMFAEDLLLADDPNPGRGTHYWFNETDHAEALEAALEDARPAGQLASEQRLLAVSAPEGADPYTVLGRGDLNGAISWIAEWGGDGELLIGMAKGTPLRLAQQLVAALGEQNIKSVQRRVGELMTGDDLRRFVTAVDEGKKPVSA